MGEGKLVWCCKKKNGIELVEQKEHLNKSYLAESEEDFEEIEKVGDKWKVIIAYYSCYEALYSILMKCGIKSEIHGCTFELMNLFGFADDEKTFLIDLKEAREGNQYYLKNNKLKQEKSVKEFILKCKEISNDLNQDKIKEIRKVIENAIE